jgi:peptidoglycan/LPS O-acetylase OafA/YrhL
MNKVHSNDRRNDAVDALRAILIFSVVAYHYFVYWAPPFVQADRYHFDHVYPPIIGIGKFGVHVFFLISGYVITMTLERSKGPGDFLFRRFSRLFPALLACSVITYVTVVSFADPAFFSLRFADWLASLTVHAEKFGLWNVDPAYWSLAVEVRFYLWVAVFFTFLRGRFWIGVVALGLLAIIQEMIGKNFTNYYLIGAYVCFFLVGMSLRYFERGDNRTAAFATLVVGLTLYSIRIKTFSVEGDYIIASNCYIVLFSLTLFATTCTTLFEGASLGPLPYLGRLSYSFYLLHQVIGVILIGILKRAMGAPDIVAIGAAFATTLTLSAFVYHFVESSGQKFLRQLWLRMQPPTAATS